MLQGQWALTLVTGSAHLSRRDALQPIGQCPANFIGAVFLNEVIAGHGDFGLIFPRAAKHPLGPDKYRARIGIDEKFCNIVFSHPRSVIRDDIANLCRRIVDRDLARPGKRRAAIFARIDKGAPVFIHLCLAKLSQNRSGQHGLDEQVFFSTIASPLEERKS